VLYLEPVRQARGAQLLCHEPTDGPGQLQLKLTLLRLEAESATRAVVYLRPYVE